MNNKFIRYKLLKIGSYMNLYSEYAKKNFNSYEEIYMNTPIGLENHICEVFFKALEKEEYDAKA